MAYEERYVCFADILGFGEIVKATATESGASQYDAIVDSLKDVAEGTPRIYLGDHLKFEFQSFSDSIVISTPIGGGHLTFLVSIVRHLAINLLQNGLLIRGGLAKGKLHHAGGVMFGPAFLEAYRLEQDIAKYPRIVLSKECDADYRRMAGQGAWLKVGIDGPPLLDILSQFVSLNNSDATWATPAEKERLQSSALKCHEHLQALLSESMYVPQHFEKVKWFAAYWNSRFGFKGPIVPHVEYPGWQTMRFYRIFGQAIAEE